MLAPQRSSARRDRRTSTARSAGCAPCCCTGPGAELKRLTPRNNDKLLFDGIPWVGRAQDEHDAFAQALRDRGVEVLYLADLLDEALEVEPAARRDHRRGAAPTRGSARRCARRVARPTWRGLHPADLADVLMAGLAHEELGARSAGWSTGSWTGTTSSSTRCPTCCSPATPASGSATRSRSPAWRCRPATRETTLTRAIYRHHPRFAGTEHGVRARARAGRGRRRAAARPRRGRRRGRRADDPGRRRAAGPAGVRPRRWRTPCSPCRSPRSGPPCTWTPSARWSTSTPWSCTRTSPTPWPPTR